MNKLFTKIASLSIGLALAIGVGVAVGGKEVNRVDAAETLAYTLTPYNTGSDSSSTNYASAVDAAIDGITWNVIGNSNQVPWRIGVGKNTAISNTHRAIFSKTEISQNISKV